MSRPLGGIYASLDHGESWAIVTVTQPISGVIQFAYDSVHPDLVYASTEGTGLLKSTDGGMTWSPITSWPAGTDCSEVYALTTHPRNAGTVYAMCTWGFLRSMDEGASWTALPESVWGPLLFAPAEPFVLYHGTPDGGLSRSLDEGQTWEQVDGLPSNANIYALAASHDEERVVVYVASSGGTAVPGAGGGEPATHLQVSANVGGAMGAGVYRLTTALPPPWLYLPLVVR